MKKPINWDSKDMELNSGSIDCIWNGFTMNGREDDYTFSVPYVDNSQVIVVAEDSGIEQLGDLAGKTVGVQAASAALDLLQSEDEGGQKELADTFGSLNEFADYNTAFTELQAGALDALAIDVGVAKYQLNSRGEGFKILDETLNTEQYAIGFKKGNQELCDIVNADLQELANEGKVAELAEKYEMRGKGIQYLNGRGRGDMYVKCEVEIPKKLNKAQRDALKKFEGTLKEENYEKRKGFFKKLKDMFNA